MVILNAVDDLALPQENQKPFAAPIARKRRSYTERYDNNGKRATTDKPIDSASPEYKYSPA